MALSIRKTYISPKRLQMLVAIFIFAAIGAYIVVQSRAEVSRSELFARFNVELPNTGDPSLATGQTAIFKVRGQIRNSAPTAASQVIIDFRYDPSEAKLLSVSCLATAGCTRSSSPGKQDAHSYKTGFVVCLDTVPDTQGAYADFFNMSFQNIKDHTGTSYNAAGYLYWWSAWLGTAPGSCASNPSGTGATFTEGRGYSCDSHLQDANGNVITTYPPCDSGSDIGNVGFSNFKTANTTATQSESDSQYTGKKSTRSSSRSGGGSSATIQSSQNNTISSSSSQGDVKQTELEPSPFFDGKQYDPGSDPDILGVNTSFAIAGHNLKYGWLLVSTLFVGLGSAATYFFWWRKHHFKK